MSFKMKGFPMQATSAFKQNENNPEEKDRGTIDKKAQLKNKWNICMKCNTPMKVKVIKDAVPSVHATD